MIRTYFISALCLLFFILSFFMSGCRFNPDMQGKGTGYLQGVWEEKEVAYQNQLLQYTSHHFTFTCDSFYAVLKTSAKANQYADSCFNNGRWTEYTKGTYIIKNDTLILTGTFTKSNFKQKISGCYRIGQYLPAFVVKGKTPQSIQLENLQQHLPINLSLRKRIICEPKPL